MAQPQQNPLLHPPFFMIPGINPSSPISVQTEQIDQLNTLLLQEIDANFAKFHQVVTSKILPEIKRFAIAGEPTREAAQFWRSFYEAAAAVRGTGAGETTVDDDETHSRTTYDDDTITLDRDGSQAYAQREDQDGSFMFGNGATASTPLRPKQGINESWESSMESPFDKNERLLRDMKIGGGNSYEDSSDVPTPSLPTGYSLSGIARDSMELNSRSKATSAIDDSFSSSPAGQTSSSTPRANRVAPVTDLRNTPLNAKFPISTKGKASASRSQGRPRPYQPPGFDFEDSDDEIVTGMSPPRTMNFGTLPARAQAIQAIARDKTPKKDSDAQAILQDLLSDIDNYQPSPKMPTPENFKRYSLLPEELGPEPAQRLFASTQQTARRSVANTSFGSDIVTGPPGVQHAEDDSFDNDDSFSSDESGTVPPPAEYRSDISYMTNTPGRPGGGDFSTMLNPATQRDDMRDTEVFGPPSSGGGRGQGNVPFEIMKQDEMYTFHGGRLEDAAGEEVDRTPLRGLGKK